MSRFQTRLNFSYSIVIIASSVNLISALDIRQIFVDQNVFVALVDIGLVTFLLYRLLMLVRGTRAWRLLLGIGIYSFLLWASDRLHLELMNWILDAGRVLGPVALVILFLPELRQAIESFGRLDRFGTIGSHIDNFGLVTESRTEAHTVEEIVSAVAEISAERTGALIVIEKGASLEEIAANGVMLEARVSSSLLCSIFYEQNPLHDGAVIIRGDRIISAASRLPLSESKSIDIHLHMRHRAAVGVTEMNECLAIVVSEERGTISIAHEGKLVRLASHIELREVLNHHLRKMTQPVRPSLRKRIKETVE